MSVPARYRKRPVEIEALHLTDNVSPTEAARWCGGRVAPHPDQGHTGGPVVIEIDTLEGTMRAEPGDWIIRGVAGEHYPCKPDIFAATYEPADQTAPTLDRDGDTRGEGALTDTGVTLPTQSTGEGEL